MLYSGEQFDPNLQMQYLRARYYDQNSGRFNRVDPFGGNNSDPQSLHKYGYAHSNPVMGIDPSGLMNLADATQAITGNFTRKDAMKLGVYIFAAIVLAVVFHKVLPKAMLRIKDSNGAVGVEMGIASETTALVKYNPQFAAQQLLKNGKISLHLAKGFVPKKSPNLFKASDSIQYSQKYCFKTNGTKIEFKFHSPDSKTAIKYPTSNSGSSWTAQIRIGKKLLGSDGKFYNKPNNKTHIPIEGM
jgi:RHS repeat-associated protein